MFDLRLKCCVSIIQVPSSRCHHSGAIIQVPNPSTNLQHNRSSLPGTASVLWGSRWFCGDQHQECPWYILMFQNTSCPDGPAHSRSIPDVHGLL